MQRLGANLLLLVIALTTTLLLMEVGLRLFGLHAPILYRVDRSFGYEPLPSQSSRRLGVQVHINDIGLRDDEDLGTLLKSPQRILVIGNSVTYGSTLVSQDELFTEVLERELGGCAPGIKVLNAGVVGYSVTQMMKRAPRLVRLTAPRHLILYVIRQDFWRPPVRIPVNGGLHEPLRRPRSALVAFVRLSLGVIDGRYHVRERFPALAAVWPRVPPAVVPPYDRSKVVDINIAAVEEFLRTVWERSGRSRSDVVAFVSPTRADVAENHPMPNADLVQRLRSLGIAAYDLQQDFHRAMSRPNGDVTRAYYDDVHYRAEGNRTAGRVVATHLMGRLFEHCRPAPLSQ